MRYSYPPLINPMIRVDSSIYAWSIGKFLLLFGSAAVILLLAVSAVVTYKVSAVFLDQAYARNAQVRALAQAHEINQLLHAARHELEYLSHRPLTAEEILGHLGALSAEERNRYREVAFQGQTPEERFVLVNTGSALVPVPLEQALGNRFGIFSGGDQVAGKPPGFVHLGDPTEVIYPSVPAEGGVRALAMHVVRLTTPVYAGDKTYRGQLTLSLDLRRLRDVISVHSSKKSPLYLFPQESEQKKSFFFDNSGWLAFQSESPEDREAELSVDFLRTGLQGDIGRPGFSTAFRPGFSSDLYWAMVTDVQAGRTGQVLVSRPFMPPDATGRTLYLSYVPVVFAESDDSQRILGGIGCIDTSFVFMASTYQVAGTLSLCFAASAVLVVLAMYFMSRRICRPLNLLAEAVEVRAAGDDPTPVALSPLFAEISQFQKSINILLVRLQVARDDTLLREGFFEDDRMRQGVDLDREIRSSSGLDPQLLAMPLYGIVGGSAAVGSLRQHIHKAARVLADVLIIGETGTGKELTAEAIHSVSHRAKGPFLSINCGALDENLLMDALFGHVKGAFTEAQTDRKGAFVAASGGTLHLDEIGNASPKVQQALLRALSVRRIRPLGSDKDMAFDARIIAATNVDLLQRALAGDFREDLFYRLAVITINTPPLRQRKEDIPVLVKYYLEEYVDLSGRKPVGISRGALEKMMRHDWPGNIRELKNCLVRSVAFAEGDLLLAEHILFDERRGDSERSGEQPVHPVKTLPLPAMEGPAAPAAVPPAKEGREEGTMPEGLNPRQRSAWPVIVREGGISRGAYQDAVGEAISVRTAQYDLRDLVAKGLLQKTGRGPASRYVVVP
ncbi:MAG: sigma 54-interacting transcriptional regulator [Desulfobulbus sp.]|nr:sigma 54-interacting transcriptional regulator [Desulfobulbus sp.]MBP8814840.1 sigma 54-interacting transcriptional regulator [Desulfobulbus sp.]